MPQIQWHAPVCVELTPALAALVRQELKDQARAAGECFGCLAPVPAGATFCSADCAQEMGEPWQQPCLVIHLPALLFASRNIQVPRHVAA